MKKITILALIAQLLALPAVVRAADAVDARVALMPRIEDYTLLWWADGPPHFLGSKVPPATVVAPV